MMRGVRDWPGSGPPGCWRTALSWTARGQTRFTRLGNDDVIPQKDGTPDTVTRGSGQDVVFGATSENIVTADCEEVHVEQPCRGLPQRVLAPLREAARCG